MLANRDTATTSSSIKMKNQLLKQTRRPKL